MTKIAIQNLCLTRGKQQVLKDVCFDVAEGDLLVIIGPSGSGKSSLLRCINRLEEIDSGAIQLENRSIYDRPVIELRYQIGMIFQKTAPFEGTVADNIAYGPNLMGQGPDRERILHLMQLASLEANLIDKPARELSGGQEQRLGIARALANNPSILLLDEPTASLDPIATHHVEKSLLDLQKNLGLTLLWVSHSIEQARRVGNRVLLLDAGKVVREDSVSAMLNPESGDRRALAFALGDDTGLHQKED